jgi:hypothetical protein
LVDAPEPGTYDAPEWWGRKGPLRPHTRSAYKAADYRTARPFTTWKDDVYDTIGSGIDAVTDAYGDIADVVGDSGVLDLF